jgi:hypothetical protein
MERGNQRYQIDSAHSRKTTFANDGLHFDFSLFRYIAHSRAKKRTIDLQQSDLSLVVTILSCFRLIIRVNDNTLETIDASVALLVLSLDKSG